MTGDVPPHDAWLETPEKIAPQLKAAFDAMTVIKAKVSPTIGIHKASPLNIFPTSKSGGDISWLYNTLADDWTRWLTSDAVTSFKHYGSYTLTPVPGFRTISFNTNFCYTLNFYLYGHTDEYDPHGEVQ
ncbi:Sphingomyelin phosphodiesterase [Mortierella sp. NVP41]|nr:Sphingomyelin phosphodiesterase [Mortierella sp. NVP41]